MTDIEYRSLVEPIEFRSAGAGKITASGVAMRYGAISKPIAGKFREVFLPGALSKTVKEQDVRSHNEHGGPYLGRTGAGTLRLTDDRSQLAYEVDLPDTAGGRDAAVLLERGDIKGSSLGFIRAATKASWSVGDDGMALRSVASTRLSVLDLTVCPVYDESTAGLALRSLADERGLELRSLLEAADRGDLPTLIASDPEDLRSEEEEEGRETPTFFRAPLTALSA